MKLADFLQYGEQGVVKPSQACSSMRTVTWFSSALCCVTWMTVPNNIILVQAISGPAMQFCRFHDSACFAKRLKEDASLRQLYSCQYLWCLPWKLAWVPTCGTTFCSLKTLSALQRKYIQFHFLIVVQFFLKENFNWNIYRLYGWITAVLPINHFLYWLFSIPVYFRHMETKEYILWFCSL